MAEVTLAIIVLVLAAMYCNVVCLAFELRLVYLGWILVTAGVVVCSVLLA